MGTASIVRAVIVGLVACGLGGCMEPAPRGGPFAHVGGGSGITKGERCNNGVDDDSDGAIDCHDPDCAMHPACASICLSAQTALGSRLPVSEVGMVDGYQLSRTSCQDIGEREATFSWVAPEDGTYVVDTFGSGNVRLVGVFNPVCPGTEIACKSGPSVNVSLVAGQPVVIVIEGTRATRDPGNQFFRLHITKRAASEDGACHDLVDQDGDGVVDCDDPDCAQDEACAGFGCAQEELAGALPVRTTGSLHAEENRFAASCGGAFAKERVLLWHVPADGDYVFDASESEFVAAVSVRDGSCTGPEVACGAGETFGDKRAVTHARLQKGQTVLVVIDGTEEPRMSGATETYALEVRAAADEAAGCANGLDDDGNGLVDGDDPACGAATAP